MQICGCFAVADIYVDGVFLDKCIFGNEINIKDLTVGKHLIKICITNGNRNLFGPHHYFENEPSFTTPYVFDFNGSWQNRKSQHYKDRYAFVKFGIDGIKILS